MQEMWWNSAEKLFTGPSNYALWVLCAQIRMHRPQFIELLCLFLRRAFPSGEELHWRKLQFICFREQRRARVEYLCARSLVHLQTTFSHKGSRNQAPFIKNLLTLVREPRCSPRHNASCHDFGLQPASPPMQYELRERFSSLLLAFRYDYFSYSTCNFTIWATKIQILTCLTWDFSTAKIIILLVSR